MEPSRRKSSRNKALRSTRVLLRRLLARLRSGRDFRAAKVRRLRAKVRARRYENDLKLAITADRLLNELDSN